MAVLARSTLCDWVWPESLVRLRFGEKGRVGDVRLKMQSVVDCGDELLDKVTQAGSWSLRQSAGIILACDSG